MQTTDCSQLGLSSNSFILKVYFKALSWLCPLKLLHLKKSAQLQSGSVHSTSYRNTFLKLPINIIHDTTCFRVIAKTYKGITLSCLRKRLFWWPGGELTENSLTAKSKFGLVSSMGFNNKIKTIIIFHFYVNWQLGLKESHFAS